MSFQSPKIGVRNIAVAYAYSFAGWGLFALLMGSQNFVIRWTSDPHASLLPFLIVPAVRSTASAILTPPLYFATLKWPFSKKHFLIGGLRYVGLAAAFIVCFCIVRWTIFPNFDVVHERFVPRSFESLVGLVIGGFADQVLMFVLIMFGAHAWIAYRSSQLHALNQINLQREMAELQLQLLQMQLHPHFIFNTLHGINTLMERDVETARSMLLHLADPLRAAISSQSQDLIQLKQELAFISSYVALEQMRLGPRLKVNYTIEESTKDALVPYMVLQPIVENAILHGAAACREGGWVTIACRVEQTSVVLEVTNSAAVEPLQKQNGLGLRNTRARLQNLFEEQACLDFGLHDGIASARIRLPMITARGAVAP
jgi:hypothetical protein